jgi:hypothetical protein
MSDRGYSGDPERPDCSRADACRRITWWLSRCEPPSPSAGQRNWKAGGHQLEMTTRRPTSTWVCRRCPTSLLLPPDGFHVVLDGDLGELRLRRAFLDVSSQIDRGLRR